MSRVILAIEAGGTTFKLQHLRLDKPYTENPLPDTNAESVPTNSPQETLEAIHNYLKKHNLIPTLKDGVKIDHLGLASFGPICLDINSKQYGYITSTPKLKWRNFNLLHHIQELTQCKSIGFDTDVNAPALVEAQVQGLNTLAYISIGTGVGVGLVTHSRPVHGLVHPEGGHMMVPLHEKDHSFTGSCPFHGSCVEGMCNTESIRQRAKLDSLDQLASLPDDHEVWEIVAHYLAHLSLNIFLLSSVERIVLGGGVMKRKCLYPLIRKKFQSLLSGYVQHEKLNNLNDFLVSPTYGERSGVAGAFELALREWRKSI